MASPTLLPVHRRDLERSPLDGHPVARPSAACPAPRTGTRPAWCSPRWRGPGRSRAFTSSSDSLPGQAASRRQEAPLGRARPGGRTRPRSARRSPRAGPPSSRGPAVPPNSSSTIAMWTLLSSFMSASTSSTSREPGTKCAGRTSGARSAGGPERPQRGQHVLGVHDADDVVERGAVHRIARARRRGDRGPRPPRATRRPGAPSSAVRGVITSRAYFSENSNTPARSRASVAVELPPPLCALLHQHPQLLRRVEAARAAWGRAGARRAAGRGWRWSSAPR